MADGQAVGRALRGAPPHAGAPGGAVLPVLGLQQLGARGPRGAHVQVAQREVAGVQVQADAVVEGEPLAAGVGHCVARPGGPQQLLVLQPHAVVQPHSVRLHFRHGHKDALGYLSAGPNEAQPRPHPHTLRAVLGCCSLATPKSMWMTSSSKSLEPSGARARFAAAFTAMRLLWLMTGVRPPGLGGEELLQPRLGLLQRGARLLADPQPLHEVEDAGVGCSP